MSPCRAGSTGEVMFQIGPLAFAAPWLLTVLVVLPVLWWLLRVTPPAPRRLRFPAARLLAGLQPRQETPAHTPWWLLLLRLILAALVILALARPLLDPAEELAGTGPLLLVVDDGWTSGADWPARRQALDTALAQAEREGRPVALLTTAPTADGPPELIGPEDAGAVRRAAAGLAPRPWPTRRDLALKALDGVAFPGTTPALWLTDGLDGPGTRDLIRRLRRQGPLTIQGPAAPRRHLVTPRPGPEPAVTVGRAVTDLAEAVPVIARDATGRALARAEAVFAAGAATATAEFDVPTELRNDMARLEVPDETTAGAVGLLDARWRRQAVGIVAGPPTAQPLLDPRHYLDQALSPYAEVRRGPVAELLERPPAALLVPDDVNLSAADRAALADYLDAGGMVIRFAGPRLAEGTAGGGLTGRADALVPVPLRQGGRAFGGALSWDQPARLAPFPSDSPFAGLAIPDEVEVRRQVLADPTPDLARQSWARLTDGTPLVTARQQGDGWLVLFHTSADTAWSDLSLSGLYVRMLRRLIAMATPMARAQGPDGAGQPLAPVTVLDGFGRPGPAGPTVAPLAPGPLPAVGPDHPPGLYGRDSLARALNLGPDIDGLSPLAEILPRSIPLRPFGAGDETDLRPWLLGLAALLLIVDMILGLVLRGLTPWHRAAAGGLALVLLLPAPPAGALDPLAMAGDGRTRLAYVVTGDRAVDDTSRAGLQALADTLNRRTSVEAAAPVAVDIETDDPVFFPLLYWPLTDSQAPPSAAARARLNRYLRRGGMILFDTRAPLETSRARLAELTEGLDIPPLQPVPADHVLTKTFYLLKERRFPGRHVGQPVWVASGGAQGDRVSPVVVGGHDWAAAWARGPMGQPRHAVVPDGPIQREYAYRFGVNLVMYALAGNYKADQVHVPAILERLGR